MSNKQLAAEALTKFLTMLDGLNGLKDDLEAVGSLEQAEIETKSRLDALAIQEASARASLANVQSEVDAKFAEVKAQGLKAANDAASTLEAARASALQIEKEANEKAYGIIDAANGKKAAAESYAMDLSKKSEDLSNEIKVKQADLDRITQAIDSLKAKLA